MAITNRSRRQTIAKRKPFGAIDRKEGTRAGSLKTALRNVKRSKDRAYRSKVGMGNDNE